MIPHHESAEYEAALSSIENRFRYYLRTFSDFGLSMVIPTFRLRDEEFCFRLNSGDLGKKSKWSRWLRVAKINQKEKSILNQEIQACLSDIKPLGRSDVRASILYHDAPW